MVGNVQGKTFPKVAEAPFHPKWRRTLTQSGGGPGVPKAAEAHAPKRQRPRYTQSGGDSCRKMAEAPTPKQRKPCPTALEAPISPKRRRPMPQSGGALMVPKAEAAPFAESSMGTGVLKVEEALGPKRHRPRYAQSGGKPLPQTSGGLGVPKAAEVLAPDQWKPLCPQSGGDPYPKPAKGPVTKWRRPRVAKVE